MRRPCILGIAVLFALVGCTDSGFPGGQSWVFPVSANRMVRWGRSYQGIDARGRVRWAVPSPDGFYKRETMQVIGDDMLTMSDRCDPG